ncbi:helix-turn-helix domain-containing protein [Curtobacterium sp. MCBA15_008]|uniref:helix-turn-helix domain-containing protein n=1 Tax=Curtobacterium sp. MCBA15_008 TaxID=1898736 RepID=UPI0008DDBDBA|nr:helix-turn-helix transcriptional regulator [Curtobacterium sp. MCBA15_008]OII06917.1 hypothetical protein BIU96_04915 [Curtobacterium sp. MCBA15_008]
MAQERTPLGEYLRARRAAVTPEEAGVQSYTQRRVPGLRRDEVARAAGISQEYYLRLEQGKDQTPSDQVLRSLARALLLNDGATAYMMRVASAQPVDLRAAAANVSTDTFAAILDTWANVPAYMIDTNHTIMLSNAMARAVVPLALHVGSNIPEVVFTAPEVRALPTWETLATRTVTRLRSYGHPFDPRLHALADRLSTLDPLFRRLWERHEVDPYYDGDVKPFIDGHGQVVLRHQTLEVPGTPGYLLCVYRADPGSISEAALTDLAERVSADEATAAA